MIRWNRRKFKPCTPTVAAALARDWANTEQSRSHASVAATGSTAIQLAGAEDQVLFPVIRSHGVFAEHAAGLGHTLFVHLIAVAAY